MNIHRILADTDSGEETTEPEGTIGVAETSVGAIDMRSQALWVLIAVSIVVGLNGVLSWL